MKTFIALVILATFGFPAEASLKGLKFRNIVMPGREEIMDQKSNANTVQKPVFKTETKRQPVFDDKLHVHDNDQRITNGNTASRGEFPWQVLIVVDNAAFCGGSLISQEWVLTAAHCSGPTYTVMLGASRSDGMEVDVIYQDTRTSTVHESYNPETLDNDITVVKLSSPVDYSVHLSPIRLPRYSQQNELFVDKIVRCSGWGYTSDNAEYLSLYLQYVDMNVMTNDECKNTFLTLITDSKICVATDGGKSPCHGDSGGPLIIQEDDGRYTEVGIVSFGHIEGCEKGYPGVFTRVTSYLNWIETHTNVIIGQ